MQINNDSMKVYTSALGTQVREYVTQRRKDKDFTLCEKMFEKSLDKRINVWGGGSKF